MHGCLMQMPQLVGIAHHIDRGDPAVLDVECRRLQFAIGLQCHETRQAIDEACADEFRLMRLELLGQIGVELHHLVKAEDRIRRCRAFAATVGMHADIAASIAPSADMSPLRDAV